jgi:hypothetical protein
MVPCGQLPPMIWGLVFPAVVLDKLMVVPPSQDS